MPKTDILIKRAYEAAARSDGYRVLVDRLWPRGLTKKALSLDEWAKELAPSTELRQWFHQDMTRWTDFQKRYRAELSSSEQKEGMRDLLKRAGPGHLTLVYGARDPERNHALVLRGMLKKMAGAA
jgi:uncharacterized protein YeaO (DUF488 family)